MRYVAGLCALGLLACRGGTETTDHSHTDEAEIDLALVEQVTESYARYADIGVAAAEVTVDAAGCPAPMWVNTIHYAYDPVNLTAMGVHLIDPSYPIDQFEEQRARILIYDLTPTGQYELAGLEWYFEPPGGGELDELPTVFGVPMDGMMEGHTPAQGMHYDLHGWLYKTSELNDYGLFNEFNEGYTVPDFWLEIEPSILASYQFYDPTTWATLGYTQGGACMEGDAGDVGVPLTNPDLVGDLDPFAPDTLLLDVNGLLLGIQWTVADDGSGPPTLFQQEMTSDGNGNYVLRVWQGFRTNPLGFFAPTNPTFACDEPALPAECLPGGP